MSRYLSSISHQALAVREGRAVANDAENKKHAKYSHLESTHIFMPVAVETLGAFGRETFIQDLGQWLITTTSDPMSRAFWFRELTSPSSVEMLPLFLDPEMHVIFAVLSIIFVVVNCA